MWIKVLVGMFLGIATGMLIGPTDGWLSISTSTTLGNWLALPGQLFLTLIQMIVIPLIFASVVRGLSASENFQQLQRMVVGGVVYFVTTTVIVTAVGASVGSPGTPGVGIVILAMELETVGIPVAGVVLIMGVDRILDMSRTAVNVCGDLVAAKLMNRLMVKTELLQATNEIHQPASE